MKILFIVNNYYATGNGVSASARRTVHFLEKAGHEVRVISGPNLQESTPQPYYCLKSYHFPVFQPIISAHGYSFAQSNLPLMEEAAKWADVVHIEEPFVIEERMLDICEKLDKPVTGTFHLYPENITFSAGPFRYVKPINRALLRFWRDHTFNRCEYVQCPTENVLDRLRRYHFKCHLEVISNGLVPDECIRPADPPADYTSEERPLLVACIGRLAMEKDQFTLLEAMRHSKYAHRIQLYFAGQGPTAGRLKKKARQLYEEGIVAYNPIFAFHDRQGLRELAAKADLCIHCATIEVEGLSIMEAMQQATVPIIAEGRYSGTSQFALDRRSIFPEKNPEALAHRIDYWLSRPEERWEMGKQYAASMKKYDIHRSIDALVGLFQKAIDDKKSR